MSRTPAHVVFGTGAIGCALARSLLRSGETGVRLVSRRGAVPADLAGAVEVVRGDVADRRVAVEVARGARAVYQVLNPPYHRWAAEFPALQDAVLAAAGATGARLVSMENVYLYGRSGGHPFTEGSAHAAHTRKGRLRGAMSRALLDAHAAGRVEVAIGRASDYYGPGAVQSNLGARVVGPALTGGVATVLGDPDQPHTYTFVPDIGEALAVLGTHPAAAGRAWHLPNDPATRTTRELVDLAFAVAGTGPGRLRSTPWPVLVLLGLANPAVRELWEMRYEFAEPFVVDSSRITAELGVIATPYAEAVAQTLAAHRRTGALA